MIDYSKVNPKKLNGNKRIVKSYLIYFAFDVVLAVAIFLLTLFKLIGDSMRAFVLIRLQN